MRNSIRLYHQAVKATSVQSNSSVLNAAHTTPTSVYLED